jgi:hypothetical protein
MRLSPESERRILTSSFHCLRIKYRKKSFLSKIIKSIEDDNKEVMNNKDKEVRTGVKKTGFAAKFADDVEDFADQKK